MTESNVDPEAFRRAMASFPTGVTVVTALGESGRSGATANSVTSLSLDPPLMLAALDRGSRTLRSVEQAGRFGINVLAAGQETLARQFSAKDPEPDKWAGVEAEDRDGIPAITDALIWIACELGDVVSGGDHVIVTGAVTGLETRDGDPLIFHGGGYRPLGQS
jgi:flavin reductase (DIM6/NTAB) family NADH-FMN oxidoreductase RutF